MHHRILLFSSVLFLFFLTNCGDSEEDLSGAAVGFWSGESWALEQTFGEIVVNSQTGSFQGTLNLKSDLTFSYESPNSSVDNIFDTFEFPKSGTYLVNGSGRFGTILFDLTDSEKVSMSLFRTDSSFTLTFRDRIMRNGGENEIEIDLFFLEQE